MTRLLVVAVLGILLRAGPPVSAQEQARPPAAPPADSTQRATAGDATASAGPSVTAAGPRMIAPAAASDGPDRSSITSGERGWPKPTVVLVKSMVVPGWGQLTNRRYFKAALAIGLESWFISGAVSNWRRADRALDRFRAEADPLSPAARQYFQEYQFYWGNRGDYLWALGLTVFISMFDAYVDAHLRPYEKDTIPGVEPPRGLELVFRL